MDHIEDAPHDLTKVDIPVMGIDINDDSKFFACVEGTLGAAHFPKNLTYSIGDELWDFEFLLEGKEHAYFPPPGQRARLLLQDHQEIFSPQF